MVYKEIENFSLDQIWRSGQCFRMQPLEDGQFEVIAGDRYLKMKQTGNLCAFDCSETDFEIFWREYFDLDRDYGACIRQINPRDHYLTKAAEFGSGIRILKQDLWEMIVTFLISQQNNIGRIRRCIHNICEAYGREIFNSEGKKYYAFPQPEAFAELDEDALKECNLGYRSKYVVRTAKCIVNGEVNLKKIEALPYKNAKEELLKLFGVGDKVAECICLFALHYLEAFPKDTHILQAMEKHYKRGFPNHRYKGIQGIMQQYIFYYELFGEKK